MSRFLLALAFIFSLAVPAFAQASPMLATGSSADSLLVSGKQMLRAGENGGSLDAMYAARATFERILADTSLAAWGHYYIALADYRIADYLLAAGEENKGAASEHLKTTVEHLKKAIEIDPQATEAYALLSSAYGRQIGLKPIKGMVLGRRAEQALKKAAQLAPDNPRVALCTAIRDFNTPGMFGGSKEKGLQGIPARRRTLRPRRANRSHPSCMGTQPHLRVARPRLPGPRRSSTGASSLCKGACNQSGFQLGQKRAAARIGKGRCEA